MDNRVNWRETRRRLLEEIKQRLESEKIEQRMLAREQELSAALRIAELHAPSSLPICLECDYDDAWPCPTAEALLDCYVPGWSNACEHCAKGVPLILQVGGRPYHHVGNVIEPCGGSAR
jgi:hypothetical protein